MRLAAGSLHIGLRLPVGAPPEPHNLTEVTTPKPTPASTPQTLCQALARGSGPRTASPSPVAPAGEGTHIAELEEDMLRGRAASSPNIQQAGLHAVLH